MFCCKLDPLEGLALVQKGLDPRNYHLQCFDKFQTDYQKDNILVNNNWLRVPN